MPGKKADAEAFASKWANKGIENQDTQRFWIDFYQNVLGVEDAVSRLEFEKPVSTDASAHDGYIDVFIPSAKTLIEQKSLGIDLAKEETRQGRKVTPAKQDRDCTDQGYDQHAENEIGRQVDYIVVPVYLIELSHGILPSPRMAK